MSRLPRNFEPVLTGSKECNRCKKERPVTEYYKNKGHRDGRLSICKWCTLKIKQQPVEIRCYKCLNWFMPKRRNGHFCNPKCQYAHAYMVYNKSPKGKVRRMVYKEKHLEEMKLRAKKRYVAKKLYGNEWSSYVDSIQFN